MSTMPKYIYIHTTQVYHWTLYKPYVNCLVPFEVGHRCRSSWTPWHPAVVPSPRQRRPCQCQQWRCQQWQCQQCWGNTVISSFPVEKRQFLLVEWYYYTYTMVAYLNYRCMVGWWWYVWKILHGWWICSCFLCSGIVLLYHFLREFWHHPGLGIASVKTLEFIEWDIFMASQPTPVPFPSRRLVQNEHFYKIPLPRKVWGKDFQFWD